jgi:hypothetical protein
MQTPDFLRETVQGIDVATFCHSEQLDPERITRIKTSLCELVDDGVERLILNFSNVECICSEFLVMLFAVRKKLSAKKPFDKPEHRNWEGFDICRDQDSSLEVISSSHAGSLVLCSVNPTILELFKRLRLCNDRD